MTFDVLYPDGRVVHNAGDKLAYKKLGREARDLADRLRYYLDIAPKLAKAMYATLTTDNPNDPDIKPFFDLRREVYRFFGKLDFNNLTPKDVVYLNNCVCGGISNRNYFEEIPQKGKPITVEDVWAVLSFLADEFKAILNETPYEYNLRQAMVKAALMYYEVVDIGTTGRIIGYHWFHRLVNQKILRKPFMHIHQEKLYLALERYERELEDLLNRHQLDNVDMMHLMFDTVRLSPEELKTLPWKEFLQGEVQVLKNQYRFCEHVLHVWRRNYPADKR